MSWWTMKQECLCRYVVVDIERLVAVTAVGIVVIEGLDRPLWEH